jgi:uncharacterized protein YggT (Ycf19 family)
MALKLILHYLVTLIYYSVLLILIGGALISYVPRLRWKPIGRFLYGISEPFLRPLRRLPFAMLTFGRVTIDLSSLYLIIITLIVCLALTFLINLLPGQ